MNTKNNKWILLTLLIASVIYGSCGTEVIKNRDREKDEINDSISIIPASLAKDTSSSIENPPIGGTQEGLRQDLSLIHI